MYKRQVQAQWRITERDEFLGAGDDGDPVAADLADDLGADLLIAASEHAALSAQDADDEVRRAPRHQAQQGLFVQVLADQRAVQYGIDAEQGAGQPQRVRDASGGGAGSQDVKPVRLHAGGDLTSDRIECRVFAGAGAGFCVLGQPAYVRAFRIAKQTRGYAVLAHGRLVQVHDLGVAQRHARVATKMQRCQQARVARARAEDGGVHFHAGGHAQQGDAIADGGEDVARGAIATDEQEQLDAVVQHRGGGGPGVGAGGSGAAWKRQQRGRESGASGGVFTHAAPNGQDTQGGAGHDGSAQRLGRFRDVYKRQVT